MAISWTSAVALANKIATDVPSIKAMLDALAKIDFTDITNLPDNAKRIISVTGGVQIQKYASNAWATIGKLMHDVDTVDGKHAATAVTANTIPVRDEKGKLPGDITGNAATASQASDLQAGYTVPVSKGGTGASTAAEARTTLGINLGTTSAPGLVRPDGETVRVDASGKLSVKITDSVTTSDPKTAASATAVKTAYDTAQSKLPLSGGTMTGQIYGPNGTYNSTATDRYLTSGITILENGVVGKAQTDIGYAPTVSFLWTQNTAGYLAFNYSGVFQFLDYYGNRARVDCHVPAADTAEYAGNAGALNGKAEGALSVNYANSSNYANSAGSAPANGGTAWAANRLRREGGVDTVWYWAGQGGQPSWLWGGNDGANMYVWNPANFSVNYANSCNYANSAGWAGSVSSIGGPRVSGVVSRCGDEICVYAPAGGQYEIFYQQRVAVTNRGWNELYATLNPGVYAGGSYLGKTGNRENDDSHMVANAGVLYRI